MMRFPKHQYIRSPALMKAYRQIPCQHCGAEDGTVCGAHSNQGADGKGRSIKADDNKCASLCYRCHSELDQGSFLTRAERETMHEAARIKTQRELIRRDMWPASVPTPEEVTA